MSRILLIKNLLRSEDERGFKFWLKFTIFKVALMGVISGVIAITVSTLLNVEPHLELLLLVYACLVVIRGVYSIYLTYTFSPEQRLTFETTSDGGVIVTLDDRLELENPLVVAPNNSDPTNWVPVSSIASGETVAFNVSRDNLETVNRAIKPNTFYGPYNATYDTLESVTVYDSQFNEIASTSIE